MKIAVDAMGGDFGPAVVVEGAVAASRELGLASVLVGDKTAVEREIARLRAQDLPLTVRHASQVVGTKACLAALIFVGPKPPLT